MIRLTCREAARPHPFNVTAFLNSAIYWCKWIGDGANEAAVQALLGENWERYGDATLAALVLYRYDQDVIAACRSVSKHYRDVRVVSVALDRLRLKYEQADRDAVDEMVAIKMPSLDVIDLVHAATEHVQRD